MPLHLTHLLNAFLLAIVLILVLEKVATRIGLLDVPSARKVHGGHVPLVGGLAMFAAFVVTVLMLDPGLRPPWEFLAGIGLLVALGAVDDRYDVPAPTKLAAQILAAAIMITPGNHVISDLGHLGGGGRIDLGPLALPFTILFVVGLVNAFNMLDGVDGLTGGAAACAFFWLALIAAITGQDRLAVPLLVLLFATLGFLVFNLRHPWCRQARVFMGDAGSMMMGACVAYFAISVAGGSGGKIHIHALLWLVAIPALDTLSLIVRRMWDGRSPLSADREHLHHLLLTGGLPPGKVTAVILALSAALGAVGAAGAFLGTPDMLMAAGLLSPAAAHAYFVRRRTSRARGLVKLATADAGQVAHAGVVATEQAA